MELGSCPIWRLDLLWLYSPHNCQWFYWVWLQGLWELPVQKTAQERWYLPSPVCPVPINLVLDNIENRPRFKILWLTPLHIYPRLMPSPWNTAGWAIRTFCTAGIPFRSSLYISSQSNLSSFNQFLPSKLGLPPFITMAYKSCHCPL